MYEAKIQSNNKLSLSLSGIVLIEHRIAKRIRILVRIYARIYWQSTEHAARPPTQLMD